MRFAGTVSWLRCYATALAPEDSPACALRIEPLELDLGFFDIQSLDERFFASWEIHGVRVAIEDLGGDDRLTLETRPVRCFLLLHRSGFAAFRWTIEFDGLPTVRHVADLHRPIWVSSPQQRWELEHTDGCTHELRGGAREAMNWVYFDIHERSMGRVPTADALRAWTSEWRVSFDRIRELRSIDEVASAYAVTLGSHFELTDLRGGLSAARGALAQVVGDDGTEEVAGSAIPWRLGEYRQGIAVTARESLDPDLGVHVPRHVQLMEFVTIQRGILRSVQRETQSVITGSRSVDRATARRWHRLLASITDDYVLHDQAAHLIESYKNHFERRTDLRTIRTLEEQVRRNLSSFESQFTVADVKTTVVLTALFGVVAALTLGPLARRLAVEVSGSRAAPSRFDDLHPGWAIGIDGVLIALVAVIAATVIRRARRIEPI